MMIHYAASPKTDRSRADSDSGSGDYIATRSFTAPPAAVFDALTTIPGLSGWWATVTGSGATGGHLTFSFFGTKKIIRVDAAEPSSTVRWTILEDEMTPEWNGTTIAFAVKPGEDGGARLDFAHRGLTPQLDCFDQCSSGWAFYLGSLVDYVDTGRGVPAQA